jgi:hypothetical protein
MARPGRKRRTTWPDWYSALIADIAINELDINPETVGSWRYRLNHVPHSRRSRIRQRAWLDIPEEAFARFAQASDQRPVVLFPAEQCVQPEEPLDRAPGLSLVPFEDDL